MIKMILDMGTPIEQTVFVLNVSPKGLFSTVSSLPEFDGKHEWIVMSNRLTPIKK